ncbi:hypothetical protein [Endozoicomonas lisbonensis]|uniref:Uncharacterized protein n=1 Tax=Endozoicomonas lisbonensis TaxID=3120522 RepID=A0ABV2SDA7_9GAMM
MSRKISGKLRNSVIVAAVTSVVLSGCVLKGNNEETQEELPPQWQQSQDNLDRLTAPASYDYIHDLDDETLYAAYESILINSQCPAVEDDQLAVRNEQFFQQYQADFMQGVFSINNIARELNRIQINLLMEDARVRASGEGELLTQEQRDVINTYQTRDDGLTVHPDDINHDLLKEVQAAYPRHPVTRIDFGEVSLEDRFRLLELFWEVDEAFEIRMGVDCSKLNSNVSRVLEAIES